MGKASKLLVICVTDPAMLEWPEVQKLVAQGHTVTGPFGIEGPGDVDGYLGPDCWMMDTDLRKYIPLAVRAMRERKYGKKGVSHGVQDQSVVEEGGAEEAGAGGEGDSGVGGGE